ncbi:type II secretion system protein [Cyanobium sp. T1B-Tous]|uniref:type II secretion system protein n=1 Tax=Cyanobium sp. T1B-Tous TaxID=2823721 RepID=UPI0037BEC321|nr:type II secretion system protein [Cyanobium sp. T1B-Tous]
MRSIFVIALIKNIHGFHRFPPINGADSSKPKGFTLVELLVGVVILSIVTLLLLSVYSTSTRFVRESKSINSKEALIDADISIVEAELAKITYCSGTQELLTTCNGQGPGGEAFYAPVVSGSSTLLNTMRDDCNNGNIISDVSGSPSKAVEALRSLAQPVGINRSVSVYDPSGSSTRSLIHTALLTYSYQKNNVDRVSRIYLLRAPVANYCP